MSRHGDILKMVHESVRFADTKASLVLAFAGTSVAFLTSRFPEIRTIINLRHADIWSMILYVVFCVYAAGLIGTIVSVFQCLWPRMGKESKDSDVFRSRLYFLHINSEFAFNHKNYHAALNKMSDSEFDEAVAQQIVANSAIATKKYEAVGRAMKWLAFMAALWLLALVLLFILAPGHQGATYGPQ